MKKLILENLNQAKISLEKFISNDGQIINIEKSSKIFSNALLNGKKILSCGNGGSMCDAMHFAEELTGRFRKNRPAFAAVAISDPSHITCVGNDFGFNEIFSRYIQALGSKGDVLLAISTSGNSENVLNAIIEAKKQQMHVITLTGQKDSKTKKYSDIYISAEGFEYADRVQELHIKIIHIFISLIEKQILYNENPR